MRPLRVLVLPALLIAVLLMLAPAAVQAQAPACPCTLFAPSDAPLGDATQDQPLEVGVKLQSDEDGFITALRFYKQPNNTGRHVGHLWSASGQLLAEAEFTGETASGWQEAPLAAPVAITSNTTYVASYHSANGYFAFSPGALNLGIHRAPLHAPADSQVGGNGVYKYGASAFPTDSWNATSYWVDAVFTNAPPADSRPPEISAVTPSNGSTGVPVSATPTATFDEAMQPGSLTSSTFTLRNGAGNPVAASVGYDAQTRKATLSPTSPLEAGQTYTATVRSGTSGVTDTAGNPLAADRTWSFSTPAACPCTVFDPGQGPLGSSTPGEPLEVGMKFRADEDGFITSLRFYKQADNGGTHVGHLWTSSGQLLGAASFTHETASGWQEEPLPTPVAITKDTTYVVSYHSSTGRHAFSPGAFSSSVDRPPLHAPADQAFGGNGVYRYGPSGFPTDSFNATNYWVDVSFSRSSGTDTRAPLVTSVSPVAGATGVDSSATVTATFDEPLAPSTVNSGSVTLEDETGAAVISNVTYDAQARKITLTPQAALQRGKSYTASILSGTSGVTDIAGNRLAADKIWSFSTLASCPCTVFRSTQGPAGQASQEQPLEVGMKFRSAEDGFITSLKFFKQSNNTGRHVGHLWAANGQLLAAATFTNETAQGWQTVELPNPVPIVKDTTYVTSYHSGSGFFALDQGFFAQGVDNPPLKGLATGVDGGNGVYHYGASAFPDTTFNASNYWVDAVFDRTVPPDTRGPGITESTPDANATDVDRDTNVTASFDEPLNPATVTPQNFTLRDSEGNAIAAAVSYNDQTRTATLDPQAPLAYGTTYAVRLKGAAGGIADVAGNPLTADKTWSFGTTHSSPTEGPGGPILVVSAPSDGFSKYYAEILRGEGLNEFSVADGPVTSSMLTGKQVVILGAVPVSDAEVATLTTWVQGGGNLVAMRPDKKLAGLLGVTDAGGTLANGYMKVDSSSASGAGIDAQTLQFHGTADRYGLNGASALATLYSDSATQTSNPAVTLRDVGSGGGQAAAFTYDLARSVVYTRQGNPAWAGQKRDSSVSWIRATDLFYGAKAGDVQPDWVDPARWAVPQADEQQRLLANLITQMNLDKAPLPRMWYLPRGEKAAVVLTGDDHAVGRTPEYLNRLKATDPPGCSVADWECPRATSYLYPDTAVTDAQAAAYEQDGFEIALHLTTGCADYTPASLEDNLSSQLGQFESSWPSVKPPATNRTHCIVWSDWASQAKAERRHGIRFDTNYYFMGPQSWLRQPGLMTGSGFPQRFADLDGSMIDTYQAMTQVTDEANDTLPTTTQIHALLDNALGQKAYYGVFTVILHSDYGDHRRLNELVSDAQNRDVPVVSSAQMLDWLDGRNSSSFGNISYSGGRLDFSISTNAKARGLQAMLPARSATGPLSQLTRDGQSVSWTKRTVKGVEYVVFDGRAGAYRATYAADASVPDISGVSATADGEGHATVSWATDEPSSSLVEYGRTASLGQQASNSAQVTNHEVELSGLEPNTTYHYRVSSTDSAGNASSAPAGAPATFQTPPAGVVDSRTLEFAAGTASGTRAGATLAGSDGELQLSPTVGDEFETTSLTAPWTSRAFDPGGLVSLGGGSISADHGVAHTTDFYDPPRSMEFSATFRPVNDQAVGFGNDLTSSPFAAFSTGIDGDPFQVYATSSPDWQSQIDTPLPNVTLGVPHRFRIEWTTASVRFYVDGALVATHTPASPLDAQLRPAISDFGLFGASVKVHWLRMGNYASTGTHTSRVLDGGPGARVWQTLTAASTLPAGSQITFETRSGATAQPGTGWSAWQAVGSGGAVASPAARFIQYRATLTSSTGFSTPTLERVQITYGAGSDAPPQGGAVSIAPASPSTTQTVTATPSGFSDPDGDPLTYHYSWFRNGVQIAGATGTTLNLAQPGNGDGGDKVRVEVYATDGRGAASDTVAQTVTVANTVPTAGTATVRPAAPSTNDVVKADAAGFADSDGDALTYRYQWFRNGAAISGATSRTLDLSQPGNGDLGDNIEVEIRAVDPGGATSPAARGGRTVSGTNSTPVEGTVALAPASPKTGDTVTATPSTFRDPDGDPLTYQYRWFRNGTAISGATSPTLNLAQAGNGDRGDAIRVDVTASDNHGATSDAASANATVANSAPAAGTVDVKPDAPTSDDMVTATVSGFSDADADALSYRYQWFRNGTAIGGASARTLDLSQAGNGDPGDRIDVDVTALDGSGGTSSTVRAGETVASGASHAVAAYGFEEPVGTSVVDASGGNDGTVQGAGRSAAGRFGRALSFDGLDDMVTVPDDASLDLSTGMTLEAWVRPAAATDWRTILFKESGGGSAYALYANGETDVPSVYLNGVTGTLGSTELEPGKWTHLGATYDGAALRLFVNGTQVGSRPFEGDLSASTGPLTFGANNVWGERFSGLIDEVRVYNRALSPAELTADLGRAVVSGTPAPPPDPQPSAIGSFSAPKDWPIVPVSLSLTSNGRIAAWDGFEAALNSEHLWDPATESFLSIPTGRNLFCAGQITIGDGRLLVVGGHVQAYEGTKDTNLYNPQTGTWTRGADMSVARWYPTVTQLPDGRAFVVSGDNVTLKEPGMSVPLTDASNTLPSIYNPANNTWTDLPQASRRMPLYPFMFLLPNGKLFDAGPDTTTRTLDLNTNQWSVVGESPIDGQSAVMYRPGKILKSGTWSDPEFPGRATTNRAAAIDMTAASPAWQEVAPMEYKRAYHTLTVLPDGKVLATGGQTTTDGVDRRTGILAAEMWDPDTNTWTTMASNRRPRLYHSSAILLPDARVLLAGGGAFGTAHNEKSGEIYSPPYLHKGPRPTITGGPSTLNYGQQFTVNTPDASRIQKVSLVRMGSVTHNLDMDQRFMNLTMQAGSGSVQVGGPSNANVAPPGMYMVFLIDDQGVPSVGKIVKVEAQADTQAPSAPGSLTATRQSASSVGLNWSAAGDNVGVTEYRVHRSTTAGFTPSATNRIATVPSGTSYQDNGAAAGTYYYRVVAADGAGNAGPASNQAVGDLEGPTVSITAPAAGATVSGTATVTATATDAIGVQSVQLRVDGVDVGAPDTASPYSIAWNTASATPGSHTLTVVARDAAGNATTSASRTVTVANGDSQPPTAPGSLTATRQSASAVGLSWSAATDNVGVTEYRVHRSTTANFTPSAATQIATVTGATTYQNTGLAAGTHYYRVVAADAAGNAGPASNQAIGDLQGPTTAITAPAAGATVSGTATVTATATDTVGVQSVQLRVDGVDVGAPDTASPYSIAWNTLSTTNGSHTLTVVARDAAGNTTTSASRTVTVANGDSQPPTAPGALTATRQSASSVGLSWTAATDNVGVAEYRVHRSTTANFTPSAATQIATVTGATTYQNTGLAAGTHYYRVVAADAAANAGPASNQAIGDLQGPTTAITAPAAGATVSNTAMVTATATDTVGVQNVQLRVDGVDIGAPDTASPYSIAWNTLSTTNGSHTLTVVARDAAGNTTTSASRAVTVTNVARIAGYGFEELLGSTVGDSWAGHSGTISGATRTFSGRFGRALTFDGVNDWVTVANAADLTPAAGLTVEAWVRPSTLSTWRSVVTKERPSAPTYALYANNNLNRPTGRLFTTSDILSSGPAALPIDTWTHLAMTWDSGTLRLYVNGTLASSAPAASPLAGSTGVLRIGGNSLASQWFSGRIDEVRIYGRPLTPAEITADMNAAVNP